MVETSLSVCRPYTHYIFSLNGLCSDERTFLGLFIVEQYRNFRKYQHGVADAKGEKYDYYSIMHYNKFSFSKNRRATITPKKAGVYIGQRVRLSATDTRKIKALYKCGVTTTAPPTTTEQPATTTKATTVGIVPTTKREGEFPSDYCQSVVIVIVTVMAIVTLIVIVMAIVTLIVIVMAIVTLIVMAIVTLIVIVIIIAIIMLSH